MPIGNESGRDVHYEVQPSNPGGNVTQPITAAMLFTVGGGAFTAAGCLADGGTGLTVIGLFLLAAALLAEALAYSRASSGTSIAPSSAKTLLPDGSVHPHTFMPGTWVAFYELNQPSPIAASQPIFDAGSTVTLKQCPPAAGGLGGGSGATYIEVTPSP